MDQPILAYTLWLSWSRDQRAKLTKLFAIPRTGESVVHVGEMMHGNIGATAKQDGHRPEDLYAITTEKLQSLIGTEDTDFYHMVQHVIDNLDDLYYEKFPEDKPQEVETVQSLAVPVAAEPAPEAEFVPRDPEELLKKKEPVSEEQQDTEMSHDEEPKTKPNAKTTKAKTK